MADSHEREPCPHRIIDDLGGAFAFGVVGGGLFHTFKGARNAPRGERTAGAIQAVKSNARRLGGSFAVWGGLFSTFDCCFIAIRSKEDPYNSIMSGFCTGATLAVRGGYKAAFKSGCVGGIILGVIEGLNIAITRLMNQLPPPEEVNPPLRHSPSPHLNGRENVAMRLDMPPSQPSTCSPEVVSNAHTRPPPTDAAAWGGAGWGRGGCGWRTCCAGDYPKNSCLVL